MTPKPYRFRQRGVAAIEFMIVAPLLLMMMLAIAELSNALLQYNTLSKAVRDGARYAADHANLGSTGLAQPGPWMDAAANLTVFGNLAGNGLPRLPELSTEHVEVTVVDDQHIRVSAVYGYQALFAAIPTFGFGDGPIRPAFDLQATVIMRAL